MEELTFLIVGVLFILILVVLAKVGTLRSEIGRLKEDTRDLLSLARASEQREKARELRASEAERGDDERLRGEDESPEEPEVEPEIEVAEPGPIEEISPTEAELEPVYSGAAPPPLPDRPVVEEAARTTETAIEPVPPKEPSKFETAAREILGKIWNWVVVGEEHRPQNVTMEYAVATTWLLRLGVLILVIGIGFFLKYSITEGIIGPAGKVALAALAGVGMLVGGIKLFRGTYDLLGQGLAGAGFATLYFSFYTAQKEGLLGSVPTFALMILVTVAAGFLAVRYSSQLIAVLGLLGGYLTPVMIESDAPSVVTLFSYLLLLGFGVFYIAWKREWRLLHYLSFTCTWLLIAKAVDVGFQPEKFWTYLPFLVGFFVLFSTVTFLYQLVHKKKSTVLELLFLFLNAGVFFGFAVYMVDRTFTRETVAVVTISLAVFYIAHIFLFLRRNVLDRGLLMSFLGLASLFVAITLPLILSKGWITVSWAVQGFIMLWIASRMRSEFLRQLAYILYLVVLARFAFLDLGDQFGHSLGNLSAGDYWIAFLERLMILGIPIVSFFAAGFLFSKERVEGAEGDWIVAESNDIRPWFGQSILGRVCFWIVLLLSFIYLNLEVHRTAGYLFDPITPPALTLVWVALALVLLRELRASRETLAKVFFWIVSAALVIKVFLFDFSQFKPGFDFAFAERDFASGFLVRLLDYGFVVAFFLVAWRLFRRGGDRPGFAATFGYAALAGIFIYSSLEVWTGLNRFLPEFRMGGISIFWALFALALLLAGILKNRSVLRGIGLILLGGVIAKIFIVDLSGLEQLYRIIAFLVLGVLVLVSSFLYLKFRHHFITENSDEKTDSPETNEANDS